MSEKNNKPVIFLAFANEQGGEGHQGYLRKLPEEVRHLEEILERAEDRGLCELVIKTNATFEQVREVFQSGKYKNRVSIFHYAGHASPTGLYLESDSEDTREVNAEGLAKFLGQQDGLELVFLNGCSTRDQAQGLLDASVSAVIATSQAIDDDVATAFSGNFYSGLAGGTTVWAAFNEAEGAVIGERGSDPARMYRHIGGSADSGVVTDEFPWRLYVRPGAETTKKWNLPDAADDPLLGLPELPKRDLPDRPYRQLNFYTEEDAEVFFGRGYQIRELYNLLTDPNSPPIILYCGQSGVGKSSLLNAGLIPRLKNRSEDAHEVRDFRRRRSDGLSAMFSRQLGAADGAPFLEAWSALESETGKPVTVIADQVEEVFTRPNADHPEELNEFLDALVPAYERTAARPRGKLILSFRKEWVQDIKGCLEKRKLPHAVHFLEALDERGIVEAIEGPTSSARLQQKYGLSIDDGLAATMAADLVRDAESAVAPTLQIRLGRMWENAGDPPHFSQELYQSLESEGFGLEEYLDREFELLKADHARVIDSGLALDVLVFHTTPRGTAEARSEAELSERYAHAQEEIEAFVAGCKQRFLLISITATGADKEEGATRQTRLAHDTLAPLIRERFVGSNLPGQRARRILESRAVDWSDDRDGDPLDGADLKTVERGLDGMRVPTGDESRLIAASRGKRKYRNRVKAEGLVLAVLVLLLIAKQVFDIYEAKQALQRKNDEIVQKNEEIEVEVARREEAADRVYAAGVTSLAAAQEDPLLASLLISSLGAYETPANAVQVALGVAHSTVPLDIMTEHDGDVNSIACSPDQRAVVTASSDASARVWAIGGTGEVVTLGRHDRRLNGAIFNPNSRQVVTWSDDGRVYVQLAHGQDSPRLVAYHQDAVEAVQFDPRDDTLLMTASDDGSVNIWDVSGEGDSCLPLPEPEPEPEAEAETDAGNDGSGSAVLESVCKVRLLAEPGDAIRSASYSPGGDHIAAVTESGALRLWRVEVSRPYLEYEVLPIHAGQIMDAVFSPVPAGADGVEPSGSTHLVTTSRDETAAIWALDPEGAAPRLTDPRILAGHSDWVNSARFSPDGRRLLTVSDDGSAVYWDPDNPSGYVRLCGHARRVVSGQFSRNGAFIVTASADDTARVWDRLALDQYLEERFSDPGGGGGLLENPECLATSPVTPLKVLQGHTDDLTGAAFCGSDQYVVTASHDDTVRLWDLTRRAEPFVLARRSSAAIGVDINWSGQLIAAAFESDPAVVVDARGEGKKTLWFAGSVDFIPERRARGEGDYVLITAKESEDSRNPSRVEEWPVAPGTRFTLRDDGSFYTAVYGPDGDRFVTSNRRGYAEVWKINRERLDCCEEHGRRNLYAEFSHDGTRIVTAMVNGTAVVGAAPGTPSAGPSPEPTPLNGHTAFLTMAAFSPDDRFLATASADGTIRVTPVGDPSGGWQLEGHGDTVTSVAFSPDGKLLVSGSDDGTARIWNVDGSGEPIVLTADGSAIRSVKFTPDGRQVVTASNDGAVRVWRFLWKDLLQYLDDSTRICLSVEQRMDNLNEGREAARAGHNACERRERNMRVRSGI